jgi:hypothetical protein
MRKALFVGLVFGAVAGWASELRIGHVQGTGIQTVTVAPGAKLSIQCPNIDGGAGQQVWYRPGCPLRTDAGITCILDAGLGDVLIDFSANADPYAINLAPNEDRVHLCHYPSGCVTPKYCLVYRRSP